MNFNGIVVHHAILSHSTNTGFLEPLHVGLDNLICVVVMLIMQSITELRPALDNLPILEYRGHK